MNDKTIEKAANFLIKKGTDKNNKLDFFELIDEQVNKLNIDKNDKILFTIRTVNKFSKNYLIDKIKPFKIYFD